MRLSTERCIEEYKSNKKGGDTMQDTSTIVVHVEVDCSKCLPFDNCAECEHYAQVLENEHNEE